LHWKPAPERWTFGLSERLEDRMAANFDHRIDVIFARHRAAVTSQFF